MGTDDGLEGGGEGLQQGLEQRVEQCGLFLVLAYLYDGMVLTYVHRSIMLRTSLLKRS